MSTFVAALAALVIGLWLLKLGWNIAIVSLGVLCGTYVWDEDENRFVKR